MDMKNFKIDENSKNETGFVIPDNYFENLESKIIKKIETKEVKVVSIFQKSKYWIAAIAAVFVMGLFLTIFDNNSSEETITNEDFLTSQTDLTTEDLAEHLTENDLKILEENLTIYDQETIDSAKENL
jgi:hypothetical protein